MSRHGTVMLRLLGLLVLSAVSVNALAFETALFVTIHNCTPQTLYPQITLGNNYNYPLNVNYSSIMPGNVATMQCPGLTVVDGTRLGTWPSGSLNTGSKNGYNFVINGLNGSSMVFRQIAYNYASWEGLPGINGEPFSGSADDVIHSGVTMVSANQSIQGACPSGTSQYGNLCLGPGQNEFNNPAIRLTVYVMPSLTANQNGLRDSP